ncbi:hypothetical protein PsorP6_011577 [Peronosclerospora sorghi]|uniref:Uncharacterized protein n=1 Tax=Peronosclerospora sorghi TaxID=230839 RepID=A0ACC0WLR9_9STRA|nr:hypothetical protein PsorP6_011577 [Peronosclerospora sorghi]
MQESAPDKTENMTNLVSATYWARVLFATDEWFRLRVSRCLLFHESPVFIADKFTNFSKWMDGWESRRKRTPGHDWCILALEMRGAVDVIDANYPPRVSIQAADFAQNYDADAEISLQGLTAASTRDRKMETNATSKEQSSWWSSLSHSNGRIVSVTKIGAGYPETRHNLLRVARCRRGPWTHIRQNMLPDGGIARLRVFGEVSSEMIDLVSVAHGGQVIGYSDAHYGHPRNLLAPGRSETMAGGWETARKVTRPAILTSNPSTGLLEVPGKDWVVLKLGHLGNIHQVEMDTNHFKGIFPESCMIYGTRYFGDLYHDDKSSKETGIKWEVVLPRVKLIAHKQHYFSFVDRNVNLIPNGVYFVKFEIFPDGGLVVFV